MIHIVHNLGEEYQGRIYLDGEDCEKMIHWTEMPADLCFDLVQQTSTINPSKCALLCSDQWATVSKTYKREITTHSSLMDILNTFLEPFSFPNGVDGQKIKEQLAKLNDHRTEKVNIIRDFFNVSLNMDSVDDHLLFGFVGRICSQKGVHLILEVAESVILFYNSRAFFIIGGMSDGSDYSTYCGIKMNVLTQKYPNNFWGNPQIFFKKGAQLNRAADFFLMPSLFEPGGIVQHEALIAGTPVICFRTGGLNDTITEFCNETKKGNGFLFDQHNSDEFLKSIKKAIFIFNDINTYARLRYNCEISFMTIYRVTKAWRSEFYRLFGKVY